MRNNTKSTVVFFCKIWFSRKWNMTSIVTEIYIMCEVVDQKVWIFTFSDLVFPPFADRSHHKHLTGKIVVSDNFFLNYNLNWVMKFHYSITCLININTYFQYLNSWFTFMKLLFTFKHHYRFVRHRFFTWNLIYLGFFKSKNNS